MLVAAIGCNIAWGFVDGVMYVLRNIVARGRNARMVRAVRGAARPEQAHGLIGDELGGLSPALAVADLERVRQWIVGQPVQEGSRAAALTKLDLRGAAGVFLLVFASTFPVVLPFVFVADPGVAKRLSAAVAIAMLFLCGYAWGRYAGLRPWRAGLVMVLLGLGGRGHRHRTRRLTIIQRNRRSRSRARSPAMTDEDDSVDPNPDELHGYRQARWG